MIIRHFYKKNLSFRKAIRKNIQILLNLGLLCSAIGLVLGHFLRGIPVWDFLAGMFMGLAFVFFITFLVFYGRQRKCL
jgi:pilus assembly protein TadC